MRHVSDDSANCLECALHTRANETGRELLKKTRSLSVTGVVAAIYLADSEDHVDIVRLARAAILEQRDHCSSHGPRRGVGCSTYQSRQSRHRKPVH